MSKKTIKIIIFVKDKNDSNVWYKIMQYYGLQEHIFVISGGDTNLIQNIVDVEYAFTNIIEYAFRKIIKNINIYFFGLFDHNGQGLKYKWILNGYNNVKCYTLKSLKIPYWAISQDGSIKIENLLYNEQLNDWVDVEYFLKDHYKSNYPLIEKALFELLTIIKEEVVYG